MEQISATKLGPATTKLTNLGQLKEMDMRKVEMEMKVLKVVTLLKVLKKVEVKGK